LIIIVLVSGARFYNMKVFIVYGNGNCMWDKMYMKNIYSKAEKNF